MAFLPMCNVVLYADLTRRSLQEEGDIDKIFIELHFLMIVIVLILLEIVLLCIKSLAQHKQLI